MISERSTPLGKCPQLERIWFGVLYFMSPVLMLFLSADTIERISPYIVLSGHGNLGSDLFWCQFVLRVLLVLLVLHSVRWERPGSLAATLCLVNLGMLQIWLMEVTSWDESWAYRLTPLFIGIGVFISGLVIDVVFSRSLREVLLLVASTGALLLSHYVTRWNTLMFSFQMSVVQSTLVLGVYMGVLLYVGVLFRFGRHRFHDHVAA